MGTCIAAAWTASLSLLTVSLPPIILSLRPASTLKKQQSHRTPLDEWQFKRMKFYKSRNLITLKTLLEICKFKVTCVQNIFDRFILLFHFYFRTC